VATRDQYNTNGLPLAPAATPSRTQKPASSKSSMQWDGDVPRPSMPKSTSTADSKQPKGALVQASAPDYYTDKLDGSLTDTNRINPTDTIKTLDGGTQSLKGYMQNRPSSATQPQTGDRPSSALVMATNKEGKWVPYNESGGVQVKQDPTAPTYEQKRIAREDEVRRRQVFDAQLNAFNTYNNSYKSEQQAYLADARMVGNGPSTARRFSRPDYNPPSLGAPPEMSEAQRYALGFPRTNDAKTRPEQLADESRSQQHDLAKINAASAADNRRTDKEHPDFKTRPAADPKLRPEIDKSVLSSLMDGEDQTAYITESTAKQKRYDDLLTTDQNMYDKNMKVTRLLMKEHGVESPSQLVDKVSSDEWDQYVSPLLSETAGYAEGGVVQPPVYGAPPTDERALEAANGYRDYAIRAESMGLPVVPFEQFSAMQAGALQGQPTGYAQGGMIEPEDDEFGMPMPESALGGAQGQGGKFVTDMNPNAPTDSVPAVVDDAQPAKLNSGEFVLPTDVVQFFGLDRLNRMIAQARKSSGETPQ